MGTIMSPVEKISNLWIEPWPNRRIFAPEKVVRVDGVTVMKLKTGWVLYCDRIKGLVCYAYGDAGPFTDALMRCLLKIGIITNDQMDEHLSYLKNRQEKSDKAWRLESLLKASERYGFGVTDEQLQALDGLICDACGKPIKTNEENVGTECNMHERCAKKRTKKQRSR